MPEFAKPHPACHLLLYLLLSPDVVHFETVDGELHPVFGAGEVGVHEVAEELVFARGERIPVGFDFAALLVNEDALAVAKREDARLALVAPEAAVFDAPERQGGVAFGEHVAVDADVAGDDFAGYALGTLEVF